MMMMMMMMMMMTMRMTMMMRTRRIRTMVITMTLGTSRANLLIPEKGSFPPKDIKKSAPWGAPRPVPGSFLTYWRAPFLVSETSPKKGALQYVKNEPRA